MNVLKSPSQYVKAIGALIVSIIGTLVTAGLLSGKAAIVAGAIGTGVTSFITVFSVTNQSPEPPKPLPLAPERINPSV